MEQQSKIGLVLVNLNSYEDTARCLSSLRDITYRQTATIVVDNASTDESYARLKTEFPEVNFLTSTENLGFTGGNNLGIKQALDAGCDHVLLLNNDTIVECGFLEPLVERLESNPLVAAVSGKIYFWPEARNGASNILWYAGCYRRWHTGFNHLGLDEIDMGQYDTPSPVPYACGCLMLMKGSVIREIGMLSDEYFIYWEEADWCARAIRKGYTCYYEPRSVIYHNFRSSELGMETPFHNYLHSRNAFLFSKRNNKGWKHLQFWFFYPWVILYRALHDLRKQNYRGMQALAWGILDYFRGGRGKQFLVKRGLIKN
jgi:GT2 family glycosyltransferase